MKPTIEFYDLFQKIYDHFNDHLFAQELPNCMIVITRKKNTFGYYAKGRWINNENVKTDELAINPLYFNKYPLQEILQTIAHEMCHLWQSHLGTPSRRTYHNDEWGKKMISIGLQPSNTGKEGGKTTGQQMMEYPIPDGLFLKVCNALIEDQVFGKLWYDISVNMGVKEVAVGDLLEAPLIVEDAGSEAPTVDRSKIKYQCPVCKSNVWGKQDLYIICGECNQDFEPMA